MHLRQLEKVFDLILVRTEDFGEVVWALTYKRLVHFLVAVVRHRHECLLSLHIFF